MTTDLIARLEELEKQATPGSWKYVLDGQCWPLLTAGDDVIFSPQGANNEPRPDADSAFAIELRNNLPAIIRALKVQQAAEAWVSAAESFEPIGRGPTNLRLAGDALVRAVKGEQP